MCLRGFIPRFWFNTPFTCLSGSIQLPKHGLTAFLFCSLADGREKITVKRQKPESQETYRKPCPGHCHSCVLWCGLPSTVFSFSPSTHNSLSGRGERSAPLTASGRTGRGQATVALGRHGNGNKSGIWATQTQH